MSAVSQAAAALPACAEWEVVKRGQVAQPVSGEGRSGHCVTTESKEVTAGGWSGPGLQPEGSVKPFGRASPTGICRVWVNPARCRSKTATTNSVRPGVAAQGCPLTGAEVALCASFAYSGLLKSLL